MDNYLNPEQKGMRDAVEKMQVILDCPLCEAHGLHVIGKGQIETRQCLNCGYASSPKFIGDKLTNEEFPKLPDEMKRWSVEEEGRIWIPSIITLPFGMLYPESIKGSHELDMKWSFASMEKIPEEKKKDFEVPNRPGVFYEQMYDTENSTSFETFLEGFAHLNEIAKATAKKIQDEADASSSQQFPQEKVKDIELPKLKKL